MTQTLTHKTRLTRNAGMGTYKVVCETCGELRGISLTLADAKKKESDHRREIKASR